MYEEAMKMCLKSPSCTQLVTCKAIHKYCTWQRGSRYILLGLWWIFHRRKGGGRGGGGRKRGRRGGCTRIVVFLYQEDDGVVLNHTVGEDQTTRYDF